MANDELTALRELAKEAGISRWHVKSAETLQKELDALTGGEKSQSEGAPEEPAPAAEPVDTAPIAPLQPEKPQSGKRVLAIYVNGYRATMDKLDAIEMMQRGAITNYLEDY